MEQANDVAAVDVLEIDADEGSERQVLPVPALGSSRKKSLTSSESRTLRNNSRAAEASAKVCKESAVRFDVSRPADEHLRTFVLSVNRSGSKKLGMRVDYQDEVALRVVDVKDDTLIASWNDSHPTMKVEIGDCVLSVNDQSGSTSDMLEEMAKASSITLSISKDYWKREKIRRHKQTQDVKRAAVSTD